MLEYATPEPIGMDNRRDSHVLDVVGEVVEEVRAEPLVERLHI